MFEKKSPSSNDKPDVFRPAKGSAKVIIGNGVKLKGDITDADEVQIDGNADITVSADNLIVGSTGNLKGTIETDNADVWGNIDGDTIHIGKYKIRLHGIDAPEIKQTCTINKIIWKCGFESSQALESIISEEEVRCEIVDTDQYRRFVAKCFVKNINLNQYMVQNGWAVAYRYYSSDYINDENIAKNDKAGIWQGKFQDPFVFRKQQKN